MTVAAYRRLAGSYRDSVLLMAATRAIQDSPGVAWGAAMMATPANLSVLAENGVEVTGAGANDAVLAVRADSDEHAGLALDAAEKPLTSEARQAATPDSRLPRSLAEAQSRHPDSNLAVISVPGQYAAFEAHKAISSGMHVLLFSDGVSVEDEIALKTRATDSGLVLMGPGAGTAVLAGLGLGFANVTRPGPVGVVAAAGTGAQEVMSLLDAAGVGVAAVIGVGGRDLSAAVKGRMTRQALHLLSAASEVEILLLVSKPADPAVLADALGAAGDKPLVYAALGAAGNSGSKGPRSARTLDEAVRLVLAALGEPDPDYAVGLRRLAETAINGLQRNRTAVRGVFSGGTLCYESMVVLSQRLGPVYSNTPLHPGWELRGATGAHSCIDAGEEQFTVSRPHPMIDPEARIELMREALTDDSTAVLLFDVVLGYGAAADPASTFAPLLSENRGASVVAHVVGTAADPQGLATQEAALREAGSLVAPTAARAALLAAAIARRDPSVVEEAP